MAATIRHTVLPMSEDRRRPDRRLRRHQQRRPRMRPYPRLRARPTSRRAPLTPACPALPTTAGVDLLVVAFTPPPFPASCSADRSAIICAARSSSGDSELFAKYTITKC